MFMTATILASLPRAPIGDAHIGKANLRKTVGHFLQHADRAFARFEIDVEIGVFVPAQLLGVVHCRVIAGRHPVQGNGDLVGGECQLSLR